MQSPKAFMLAAHGAKMPAIGYGTMELPQRGTELVAYAIQSGYRLIDTARKYGTEGRSAKAALRGHCRTYNLGRVASPVRTNLVFGSDTYCPKSRRRDGGAGEAVPRPVAVNRRTTRN
jgi:hypothetical protein